MAGPSRRGSRMTGLGSMCLLLLFTGALAASTAYAGDLPDASARHRGRMMALSLRIAQAEGNEGKVRKYKSFARQHLARRNPPAPFSPLGKRVSRPGRTP